jgi:hypothetical protein
MINKISKVLLLTTLATIFLTATGYAASVGAEICGDPPSLENKKIEGDLKGAVSGLAKYLGGVDLSGKAKIEFEERITKYDNPEETRSKAYFEYQMCILIVTSDELSDQEKINELKEFRREFYGHEKNSCRKPTTPVLLKPSNNTSQPNHWYGKGEPWKFSWLPSKPQCEDTKISGYQIIIQCWDEKCAIAEDRFVEEPNYVGGLGGTISASEWGWKVRALDDWGRYSAWSERRKFYVQEWKGQK